MRFPAAGTDKSYDLISLNPFCCDTLRLLLSLFADNLSAGGALVAPSVPCTLLTPIAPHALASRPFIVPESSHVEVTIPESMCESGARATFDGRTVAPLPARSKVRWPFMTQDLAMPPRVFASNRLLGRAVRRLEMFFGCCSSTTK